MRTPTRLRQMGDFLQRQRARTSWRSWPPPAARRSRFLAVCGKNAIAKGIKAGDLVKNVCPICGGKGGGKPDSAMGGGTDVLKLDDALAAVDDLCGREAGPVSKGENAVC